MSFFDLPESQRYIQGDLHEQENVAVYTWGEDSYDGLGNALLEGGDELNDETFGGTGEVGKFHFKLIIRPLLTVNRQGLRFHSAVHSTQCPSWTTTDQSATVKQTLPL